MNRRKIGFNDKELAHDLSVHTDEDYVSEMRFRKCLLDATAKIGRKYVKNVKANIDYSKKVDDKCIECAQVKVSDSALQESERWFNSLQPNWKWTGTSSIKQ